ncbi:hypothetical protein HU200_029145 [Digitaria exilis]|uniref:Uncharacterized protein n=1 Tax=Digitaria exilis TaxID=1010633 RepID=A0A835C1X4_9POAL|nr:hypothetical protein HU200_029145 [Digitaria exilis]CAB3489312.1 unnamed protein product [Digitaria exilis]
MPIGQTRPPQPPPPPPTPPATTTDPSSPASTSTTHRRRHRHRTFSSSSSSSSSSLSTVSSAASSPSPSPRRRAAGAATSVPFSWEHHPGIPKTTTHLPTAATNTSMSSSSPPTPPLPLPPPPSRPRHHHHHSQPTRRRRATAINSQAPAGGDPFAAALAECTRERADNDRRLMDSLFPSPSAVAAVSSSSACVPSRRWCGGGGVAGLLDLYGCKTAMGVAESAFVVRRPVAVVRAGRGRVGLGWAGLR